MTCSTSAPDVHEQAATFEDFASEDSAAEDPALELALKVALEVAGEAYSYQ